MSMFPIATFTVGSGGSGAITLSNIPQTFAHLELRLFGRVTNIGSGANIEMRFNGDSGANYRIQYLGGQGTTIGFFGDFGASQTQGNFGWVANTACTAGIFSTNIVSIMDYTSTNKSKAARCLTACETNNSATDLVGQFTTLWNSTAAIASITLLPNWAQYTRVDLYGIGTANATGA
jgi:hypothetical protein